MSSENPYQLLSRKLENIFVCAHASVYAGIHPNFSLFSG
ncbi:hypothetical protein MXB_2677 [Myxobolus squamalis]|nr:hypothetical protein MXB_2677 [Myxobolus squamalis]